MRSVEASTYKRLGTQSIVLRTNYLQSTMNIIHVMYMERGSSVRQKKAILLATKHPNGSCNDWLATLTTANSIWYAPSICSNHYREGLGCYLAIYCEMPWTLSFERILKVGEFYRRVSFKRQGHSKLYLWWRYVFKPIENCHSKRPPILIIVMRFRRKKKI